MKLASFSLAFNFLSVGHYIVHKNCTGCQRVFAEQSCARVRRSFVPPFRYCLHVSSSVAEVDPIFYIFVVTKLLRAQFLIMRYIELGKTLAQLLVAGSLTYNQVSFRNKSAPLSTFFLSPCLAPQLPSE